MTGPTITFDIDPLVREISDTQKRQVPFAMALALNRTAEEMQAAIRRRIYQRGFTLRTAATARWVTDSIKIRRNDRATKLSPVARVRIESAGKGGGRAGLLRFLESGGVRFSQFSIGSGLVFGPSSVVTPIRANPMEVVPRALYPSMTGIQERRSISGKLTKATLKGKRGTFAIRTSTGKGIVLQRTGKATGHKREPGQRDPATRAIFAVTPRVQVRGREFFFGTAERTAMARFEINFEAFMLHAARTAR